MPRTALLAETRGSLAKDRRGAVGGRTPPAPMREPGQIGKGVVGRPSAAARSETQPLRLEGRDVIHQILLLRRPGDVMSWWNSEEVDRWTQPLSEWEEKYIEAMSSPTVPEPIRMWPPVTPESLPADQVEEMERLWGKLADPQGYSNWKNRHRILKHYFMTHPATVRLLMQMYEVSRDANLLAFSLARGWQMASGKGMFTDQDVSRLGAAAEFFTMLATTVAVGNLLQAARPVAERSGSAGGGHLPDATNGSPPSAGPAHLAAPSLPAFVRGGRTAGVLRTASGDLPLQSGWTGPASSIPRGTSGFDVVTRTHVEGHAAAAMRTGGVSKATLYINNPSICPSCSNLLPRMLPPGSRLTVVTPSGSTTFVGVTP